MRSIIIAIIAVIALASVNATHLHDEYHHTEPSYWQSFKNALSDMNPFTPKLGHDWTDTQHRVENIYRDTQQDAQRRVAELKDESLKDVKELQQKVAEIYLQAATEAEKRIDRLKRPIFAAIFQHGIHDEYSGDHDERGYVDRAKDYLSDTARDMKKKWAPHEQAGLLDEATKKMHESYRSAMEKAKELAGKAPSAGESLSDAKQRAIDTYREYMGRGHHEARTTFQNFREKLGHGMHKAGDVASAAGWKTWHLLLHTLIGIFWLSLGALTYGGIKWWIEKQAFKKQLAAPVQGPVVLSKIFTVFGTEDTQRKFQEYWDGAAAGFFSRQPGVRKFSLQRGVDIGSNTWCHLSEWNSIEDLRRAVNQPELQELKKRMPRGVISKRCISQVVSTGKGGAVSGTGATGAQEGDVRSEGLRNRGPGASQ